jgi:hypothetical protein
MRYTKADLLAWAKDHHYPYLILSDTDRVRHGELAWRRLLRNKDRRQLAWARIARWQELLAQQTA